MGVPARPTLRLLTGSPLGRQACPPKQGVSSPGSFRPSSHKVYKAGRLAHVHRLADALMPTFWEE